MEEILYGVWSVRCSQLNWDYGQRYVISGSDSSDGIYDAVPGTELARVSGREWSIKIEFNWNREDAAMLSHSTRKG